jgi:hypothetical protein
MEFVSEKNWKNIRKTFAYNFILICCDSGILGLKKKQRQSKEQISPGIRTQDFLKTSNR